RLCAHSCRPPGHRSARSHVRPGRSAGRGGRSTQGGLAMDLTFLEQMFGPTWPAVWTLAKIVAIVLPLLACVAYLTLWERKVIGWMQVRRGPNRVTFFGLRFLGGLAQPIADAFKLL